MAAGATRRTTSGNGTATHEAPFANGVTLGTVMAELAKATDLARGSSDFTAVKLTHLPDASAAVPVDFDLDTFLDVSINRLETARNAQVDQFLHHPRISGTLAIWKSIQDLVLDPIRDEKVCQVSLIPARKGDVVSDFKRAGWVETETEAYRMLVRQRYGQYGGNPFLICLTDIVLGPGPDDLKLAAGLARLGAKGHMPVLPAASPAFFKLKNWSDLPPSLREIEATWSSRDNDEYRVLRETDEARFIPITMLRLANRTPFGHGVEAEGMESYVERVSSPGDLSWVTANFAVARLIAASLSKYGWPAAIIGDYGGMIRGLYSFEYEVDGETLTTCPTEFGIDDHIELFFEQHCGFLAPVHRQGSNVAALFAAPTIQSVLRGDPESQADADAGAKLPNLLVQCIFAHVFKVMLRAMIGSGMKRDQIQAKLQSWANDFVSTDESATDEHKSERPFSKITVEVERVKGRSGVLQMRVVLVPRFRVAAVTAKILIMSDDTDGKAGQKSPSA